MLAGVQGGGAGQDGVPCQVDQPLDLDVDTRSDVYSLGVLLYELLTGHVPFMGETVTDVLSSIISIEPKPLTTHAPHLPWPGSLDGQELAGVWSDHEVGTGPDELMPVVPRQPELEKSRG